MNTTPLLPFDVRPFHQETLDSYSRRLLAANFCNDTHRAHLTRQLQTDNTAEGQRDAWLRVLTTRTKRTTLHLDAHPSGGLTHRDGSTCNHFAQSLPGRIGCTLCSKGAHIDQNPHFDTLICTTHHRWLGLWGAENTQHRIDDETLNAHRTFVKLRRNDQIDLRLYRLVTTAIAEATHPDLPIEDAEPLVFAATVRAIHALTLDAFARRFFTPAGTFVNAYGYLDFTVSIAVGAALPTVSRALWIYLHPTMLTLRDAITTGTAFKPVWEHDYPIRPQIAATLTTYTGRLEPTGNYLPVTGDTPASAARSTAKYNTLPAPLRNAKPLTFTCPEGHTFDYLPPVGLPATMTAARFIPACGLCTDRRVQTGHNDVQTMSPAAAAQFDLYRNGGLTAADISNSSSIKYWWTCDAGHSHDVSPSKKTLPTYRCAICSNRTPRSGTNCVVTTHPEAAAMWAGGWSENFSPSTITPGSNMVAPWRCDNGHHFDAPVYKMTFGMLGCATCKREQATAYENCFAATHPDKAARWHPTLNGKLTPRDVTHGERRWVWWLCDEDHPEKARLDKVSYGQQCRVCSNRRLKKGYNDLGTVEPVLSLELHPYLNRHRADQMFPSDHALHWKCLANGHDHVQTTQNRRSSNGCPKCKSEERILYSAAEAMAA